MTMTLNGLMKLVLTLMTAAMVGLSAPAAAQEGPADNMQILREKMQADKKLLVSEYMQLTRSEAEGFWPVYEDYQAETSRLTDRTLRLIKEYAGAYGDLSDDTARRLVGEHLAIEKDRAALIESYLPRFRKVLPERKVARFYQLENKIRAAVNYELAKGIPLVR